jgi:N-methylhydantoinase A
MKKETPLQQRRWAIGIDIGGTFTDVVALDHGTGQLHSLKVLTTHLDPADGVMQGLESLMSAYGIEPVSVTRMVHATTLFTNALIERRGAVTGLLATRGFADVIEIGNERKYELYDLTIEQATPLVPRDLRMELGGRLDAQGRELELQDEAEIVAAVRRLLERGVESVAVCLLHSYVSSVHEAAVVDCIRREFPGLSVTASCEVAPVIREFERISTTVANAYIRPLATRYLEALVGRLEALGFHSGLLMMLSNGGLSHVAEAKRNPIELLESGPAAGAISAAHYSQRDGQANLLAFDMGGTTAKLCLVEQGQPSISFGFEAARQKRFAEGSGLPVRITTVDLIEIGAGGGSIAYQDRLGLLKVGPQSAGSEPGPACYGRGGVEPTVTDANLVLGYLDPANFAGGTVPIDVARAETALTTLGQALGRDLAGAAWGIHDVVAENMASAARVHIAERGRDPADFVLLCTGGGGPVHCYYVAQKIGVRQIICPPSAGVASAYGLLVAPARTDRSRTMTFRTRGDSPTALEAAYVALEAQVGASLAPLLGTFGPVALRRRAEGRFIGQGFNLAFTLPDGPYAGCNALPAEAVREAIEVAFKSAYQDKFGRIPPNVPVELVNLRVSGEAPPLHGFAQQALPAVAGAEPRAWRQVYFREEHGYLDTPVYDREALGVGFRASGPLVVEEAGSSLIVGPRGRVEQLPSGNIVVTIADTNGLMEQKTALEEAKA